MSRPTTARMLELAATETEVMLHLDSRDDEALEAAAKAIATNATLKYLTIEFDPPRWGWKGTFISGPLHNALQRNASFIRLTIIGTRTPKSWEMFVQRNVLLQLPPRRIPLDAVEDFDDSCDLASVSWAKPAGENFAALGAADRVDGGAEGAVYRVSIDGVEVAGKQPCYLRDPEFYGLLDPVNGPAARAHKRKELLREAHALRMLDGHPNVVGFRGVFYTMLEGVTMPTWICMTYLEKTLHVRIRDGEAEFIPDMLGIASGLEHIHNLRMMHRDLKPKNILVAPDGTVVVADFGFTKVSHVRTSQNPAMHTGGGTPAYRAPEADDEVYDATVDIYSMGIIGVEILTSEAPARTDELRRPQIQQAIDEHPAHACLIRGCTSTSRGDRPASRAVAAVLRAATATNSHIKSNVQLAMEILNHGVGPHSPCEEAARLLRSAADHGNPDAMCELGVCLLYGRGGHCNRNEAKSLWRQAASQGCAEASCLLACYDAEYRSTVDSAVIDAAVARWRARAAQSHADAQCVIGECFSEGVGVTQDDAAAAEWYRLSADQGCAAGQSNLGWCYRNGRGVPRDYRNAVRLYQLAADSGHPIAPNNLGTCYEYGEGVPKDPAEALRLYRLSAQQDQRYAQYNLGRHYMNGTLGLKKDLAEAKRWLTLGAEQDQSTAVKLLKEL